MLFQKNVEIDNTEMAAKRLKLFNDNSIKIEHHDGMEIYFLNIFYLH